MEFSRCARAPLPAQQEKPAVRGRSLKTQQRTSSHVEVDVDLGGPGIRTEASFHQRSGSASGVIAPEIPRKEVIQPQLPLRLPCYDFTPITDPTFDGCLPCGLAHRLRVLPTFVV